MERLFGAHLSIAGGYYKAVEAAARLGMTTCQIFTKNNNQWRARPITVPEADAFHRAVADAGSIPVVAHNAYLINLGSGAEQLRQKSIDAMVVEIERAGRLGIRYLVAHPGSHGGAGEAIGLERIGAALDEVFARTAGDDVVVALETTAGQGAALGYRFEHLAELIRRSSRPDRLAVCLDTCHIFAAGYSLSPNRRYRQTMHDFDRTIGLDRLAVLHLNDSKRPLGSRVDRHEHIGRGCIGEAAFGFIVNDRRLAHLPMIFETPKDTDPETGRDWDEVNLRTLRRLVKRRTPRT
jgi:deoxyribonuclease-4